MQAADRLGSHGGELEMPLGEHPHHLTLILPLDGCEPVATQSSNRDRAGVVLVVLIRLPRRQHPHPRSEYRWNIEDRLTRSDELLRQEMAESRGGDFDPDPTIDEVYAGARGGAGPSGIRVHSVRMRGMVAHQEVILGAQGQTLTIRQDSYDRDSFMPGVVLACKKISTVPGLSRSLDTFLD